MKIGVFAYNFPHWKTQVGIQNLCIAGYKPSVILAADPVELSFYKSKVRIAPKDLFLWHPKTLAEHYGIDYRVVTHNSQETNNIIQEQRLDVGVILGARILKPIAFDGFSVGVLNMHPGILPDNRGLDNVKWAILNGLPQGVTTHLIDERIDRGFKILQEKISIYKDDSIVDITLRLQNLEQKLMIKSLDLLGKTGRVGLEKLGRGVYYKSVPEYIERSLTEAFEDYKSSHSLIG